MSSFDLTASKFEHYRALPGGVPEAIRRAIREFTGAQPSARILDLGAGSGRIGRAFVDAGDFYVGVDFSSSMLSEFRARNSAARLFQADGGNLPFPDGSFDLVLLMQVLSGADNWRSLISEAMRVLVPGGFIVVGKTVTPSAGVDARMKKQLKLTLQEMGAASHDSQKSREQSLEWLRAASSRRMHLTPASWTALRTAREFVDRHRTAARFSSLPPAVQEEALKKVSDWAQRNFGSLDKVFAEQHSYELHVFKIGSQSSSVTRKLKTDLPAARPRTNGKSSQRPRAKG